MTCRSCHGVSTDGFRPDRGKRTMVRRLVWSAVCVLMASIGLSAVAHADPASTPITGGNGVPVVFAHTTFDLAERRLRAVGVLPARNGRRLYARRRRSRRTASGPSPRRPMRRTRPASSSTGPFVPRHFNGTVVVEWLNVTGGADASPDWVHMHDELIRDGYAWVGVSAQAVGVNALKLPLCPPESDGPCGDPVRYAVADAPRRQLLLRHLLPGRAGHPSTTRRRSSAACTRSVSSGSASRSRPDASSPTSTPCTRSPRVRRLPRAQPGPRRHTALAGTAAHRLGSVAVLHPQRPRPCPCCSSRPRPTSCRSASSGPDSPTPIASRRWEVAGTSHFDQYGLALGWTDTGSRAHGRGLVRHHERPADPAEPELHLRRAHQHRTADLRAARGYRCAQPLGRPRHSNRPPRLVCRRPVRRRPGSWSTPTACALGGIRTPAVDAPVATLSGARSDRRHAVLLHLRQHRGVLERPAPTPCTAPTPGSPARGAGATSQALKAGFLEREDAVDLKVVGVQSDVLK